MLDQDYGGIQFITITKFGSSFDLFALSVKEYEFVTSKQVMYFLYKPVRYFLWFSFDSVNKIGKVKVRGNANGIIRKEEG